MKTHVAALIAVLVAFGCAVPAPISQLADRKVQVTAFSGDHGMRTVMVDFGWAESVAGDWACPHIEAATWRGTRVTPVTQGEYAQDPLFPNRHLCEGPRFTFEEPESETAPGVFEAHDATGTIRMEFPVLTRAALVPVDPAMALPGAQVANDGQVVYRPSEPVAQNIDGIQVRLVPTAGALDRWVQVSARTPADGTLVVTFLNPTHEDAKFRLETWAQVHGPATTCQGVAECLVDLSVVLESPEITVLPQW